MKHVIVLLLIATFISCRKDAEKPTLPDQPGAAVVRLQLQGDFLTSESPLPNGRQTEGSQGYAKTLRDSTLYAVMVDWPGRWPGSWDRYSSGLFNQRDSIILLLPKDTVARISAYVYRKGSGEGLYYEMRSGVQYFVEPLKAELTNQMDSLHRAYYNEMTDTLSWLQLADPANLSQALPFTELGEIDAHYGTIAISTTAPPPIVNLPMKRAAFGVQLAADNFTTGKLLLEFPGSVYRPMAQPQSIMPAGLSEVFIYSADVFKHQDTFWGGGLEVSIKWIKAPGDTVSLGQKNVQFKRNVLTRLKVTLPGTGRSSAPAGIIETHSALPQ